MTTDPQNITALVRELQDDYVPYLERYDGTIVKERIYDAFPAIASAYLAQEEKLAKLHQDHARLVDGMKIIAAQKHATIKIGGDMYGTGKSTAMEALSSLNFPPTA